MGYAFRFLWMAGIVIAYSACSDNTSSGDDENDTGRDSSTASADDDSGSGDTASEDETESEENDAGSMLALLEVTPGAVSRESDAEMTIAGSGFQEGMTVSLSNENADPSVIEVGEAQVTDDGEVAVVVLPADPERVQGLYDLTVTNPNGDTATLKDAVNVSFQQVPAVTEVEPALAWQGDPDDDQLSDRTVQIKGTGFFNTPWVEWQSADDPDLVFQAVEVAFIDGETLVAVVPSESEEMPVGTYRVFVTNPDQLTGQWLVGDGDEPGDFEITGNPSPVISGIDPVQLPFNTDCTPFTVSGTGFDEAAEVAIVGPEGDIPLEVTSIEETAIVAGIPANTVEIGLYPIRVTNPDGQTDVFYAYEAKNPTDGHFYGSFESLPSETTVARERLGLAYGFDDFGGTHLFASGGLDADNDVLGGVETAAVNIHGDVGAWHPLVQWKSEAEPRVSNDHLTARHGHAMVRVGSWLFAIGGNAEDTSVDLDDALPALASVESARILGADTMPEVERPTASGEGALPLGTWYYRVSALGPWGEGLASNEVQILNAGGALSLCWPSVPDATDYNVYRTVAADGRPQTARLVATVAGSDGSEDICFEDDGEVHPAPGYVSPETAADGSLDEGIWIYRLTAVVGGVESPAGHRVSVTTEAERRTVTLRWQEVPEATYNVYRTLAAADELSGTEETFLIAEDISEVEWTDDGTVDPNEDVSADDGIAPLPVGSLSLWQSVSNALATPREGAGAAVVALEDRTLIYVAGGRQNGGGSGYLATVEVAEVREGGGLGKWSSADSPLVTGRAFFPLLTNQPLGMSPITPDPLPAGEDETLLLFAVAGDESFAKNGQNSGITTIEAARIDPATGELSDWVEQVSNLSEGRRTYGHGAAVIDDYLYAFPGVDTEQDGTDTDGIDREPLPLGSVSSRFEIVIGDPLSNPFDDLLTNYMSSNGGLAVPRSYYGAVRVNAHIILVGGNDGEGPVASIESIRQ